MTNSFDELDRGRFSDLIRGSSKIFLFFLVFISMFAIFSLGVSAQCVNLSDDSTYASRRQFSYPTDSYTNPPFGIRTTFQRGEVYRFGIQFFDDKGRKLFTKWSCDLRIPRPQDSSAYDLVDANGDDLEANYIYPRATISDRKRVV